MAINTGNKCVYSPACAASGGLNCFEQTGCRYVYGFPSNPCESLSETYPAVRPMTYGASGQPINTGNKCVYSPACAASGGLNCFEQTGCKYVYGFGKDLSASFPSNPCESLSETYPAVCPMTYGASGQPINTEKKCVYSPACAASGGLNCFEQTGCKYSDAISNPCESLSET